MCPRVISLALSPALCTLALAQTPLEIKDGIPSSQFGVIVAAAGDVDDDGVTDYIVGATNDTTQGWNDGAAFVYSGASHAELFAFYGAGKNYGISVDGIGDLDGDGHDDFIVSSLGPQAPVRVYSGATGAVLREWLADAAFPRLGGVAVNGGDVDGDGVDDVLCGDWTASQTGGARVYSGATGAVLLEAFGQGPLDHFGISAAGAGDTNGDGRDDIVVGAWLADEGGYRAGAVYLYSGLDGALLRTHNGPHVKAEQGTGVAGLGDVDGDGLSDYAFGVRKDSSVVTHAGKVSVRSGATGAELYAVHGASGQYLGSGVDGLGDLDGDGVGDFGATYIAGQALRFRIHSGRDGALIFGRREGVGRSLPGVSAAALDDLDGDGVRDFVVGDHTFEHSGFQDGRVTVYGSAVPSVEVCAPAVPNSTGSPARLLALGVREADDSGLVLTAQDLPQQRAVLFLCATATQPVAQPGGSAGVACVGGSIGRFKNDLQFSTAAGGATLRIDAGALPTDPLSAAVAGETWTFQAWYRDAQPAGSNFTNGLEVTFD